MMPRPIGKLYDTDKRFDGSSSMIDTGREATVGRLVR